MGGGMMRRDSMERERVQFEMRSLFIGRDGRKEKNTHKKRKSCER